MHTQTQVQVSAWQSWWAHDGEHGDWCPAGSPKGGTSNGPKPLPLSYLQSVYSWGQTRAITLLSMGTTGESSRAGGREAVPTNPPTTFSNASSSSRRIATEWYILDTSQALRTQPTLPPAASTSHVPSCFPQSPSPAKSGPSYSRFDPGVLTKSAAIKLLARARNIDGDPPDAEEWASKQHRVLEPRPHHIPIPSASTTTPRGPAPYPQHLPCPCLHSLGSSWHDFPPPTLDAWK